MNKTLQAVHDAILAERAAWTLLTPEQKIELVRAQQLKEAAERAEEDSLSQKALDEVLGAFMKLQSGLKPMTTAQELEYRWKHRVSPQMAAIGIEPRHRVRIAPAWNCPEQEYVFDMVKDLCVGRGAIVILAGNRGAGKTTISCQLMRGRIEAWCEWNDTDPGERRGRAPMEAGRYEKLSRLGAMFKPLYSNSGTTRGERLNGLFETWCDAPFLCIDEIHESEGIASSMLMLTDMIDRRYAKNLDSVLISNHEPAKCQGMLDASIVSRSGQHGAVIPCQWESWRARA